MPKKADLTQAQKDALGQRIDQGLIRLTESIERFRRHIERQLAKDKRDE